MTAAPGAFQDRHIGTDRAQQQEMCSALGVASADALAEAAVPAGIAGTIPAGLVPEPVSEAAALDELRGIAAKNRVAVSLIGLGYYGTVTPAVIRRGVLENPSWYTAYTPYQPEISQGRLEALLNFQTMVSSLTGLGTANASMLDEATAVVEAMLLARRASRGQHGVFACDADLLPQTRAVLENRASALGIELVEFRIDEAGNPIGLPAACFGAVIQYPGASGRLVDPAATIAAVKDRGAIAILAADILSLALLASPGDLGADVAVGSTQRFGVPMGFGGPHAGYLAVRSGLERQLPGRLVGVSVDADGAPAYRLALQTREQHIRREKATSNICTAQVLLAVMASMYAVYHGPEGIRSIAHEVAVKAARLAGALSSAGLEPVHGRFFDTLQFRLAGRAERVCSLAREGGINLWQVDADTVQLSVDETTTEETLERVAALLGGGRARLGISAEPAIPVTLVRRSGFLEHPVFSSHHSETGMMRYLRRLADLDYALDRGMIPLGSCTMKLNAAAEMAAVTWPGFADIHPFAPEEQVGGYRELLADLERWLCAITGYDRVSLQPNAGSQGELAGLLAIRGYHLARGEASRTVCLIPASAHGTNAASAVLAGMTVVVVECDESGDVDLADLRAKIDANAERLAALMITYPSTHGVYERAVGEICDLVHAAGGQVYVDGANLNALVGFAAPGRFGGDVSHLNLHKTFCIPHGGGGPGVGPVAVRAHLAEFLPGHPLAQWGRRAAPVSAAPFGSPSILPISWAYIRMMGASGLRAATASAVLAANYLAVRLSDVYPVLYSGQDGRVAHECILDLRPLTRATGVSVDDVAKRLVDYGFHAPTMSFPVPGTLMVEPTESEDKAELDRFVAAMRGIRAEADRVADGTWPLEDSPLRGAPHTAAALLASEWDHPYSRELAAYPFASWSGAPETAHKYWPPVRRIDGVYGDRHLVCTCPAPDSFAEQPS